MLKFVVSSQACLNATTRSDFRICIELYPQRPVERPVLDGSADVLGGDGVGLCEVGDGTGDF